MRIGISIAVVVAIGLIWSVAVMSEWIPMASAELMSGRRCQALEGPAVTQRSPWTRADPHPFSLSRRRLCNPLGRSLALLIHANWGIERRM